MTDRQFLVSARRATHAAEFDPLLDHLDTTNGRISKRRWKRLHRAVGRALVARVNANLRRNAENAESNRAPGRTNRWASI
jgi:hypothetical protein